MMGTAYPPTENCGNFQPIIYVFSSDKSLPFCHVTITDWVTDMYKSSRNEN